MRTSPLLTDGEVQWLIAVITRLDVADEPYRKQILKKLIRARDLPTGAEQLWDRNRKRKTA